jgi:hypothetical protein
LVNAFDGVDLDAIFPPGEKIGHGFSPCPVFLRGTCC